MFVSIWKKNTRILFYLLCLNFELNRFISFVVICCKWVWVLLLQTKAIVVTWVMEKSKVWTTETIHERWYQQESSMGDPLSRDDLNCWQTPFSDGSTQSYEPTNVNLCIDSPLPTTAIIIITIIQKLNFVMLISKSSALQQIENTVL